MNSLNLLRFCFKFVRGVFRATRVGQIPIGNSLLHKRLRKILYPLLWKVAAPDLNHPLKIQGHEMCGIGPKRGAAAGIGLLMDSYEEGSAHIFKNLIEEGMCVVDIGAHIGYYTLIAAEKVGDSGRVYAFEPELVNYKWLLKNIEMNGYRNVTPVPKSISDRSGSLKLYLGKTTGTHSICPWQEMGKESVVVDTTTLDDFLSAEDWPSIDIIKMDIEGAETLALNGMKQLLKRQKTLTILIEFNPYRIKANAESPLDFLQMLKANGFLLHAISEKDTQPEPLISQDLSYFVEGLRGDNVNLLCCKQPSKSIQTKAVGG